MKNKFFLLSYLIIGAFFLSGCMLNMQNALIQPSNKAVVPNVSGAYTNQKKESYIVRLAQDSKNSFTVTAPDKTVLTVTLEPLATKGGFIAQLHNPNGPEVALSICKIIDQRIELYALQDLPGIMAIGKKYGVTIDENGNITQQKSFADTKKFFNELFNPKYSSMEMTIQPGSSKK